MGAWGFGVFENDDALDWVEDFSRARDKIKFVSYTILDVQDVSDPYTTAPQGARALAAAETIAALRGQPSGTLPEPILAWIAEQNWRPGEDLLSQTQQLVVAISADSELRDLFSEGGDTVLLGGWQEALNDLRFRLGER